MTRLRPPPAETSSDGRYDTIAGVRFDRHVKGCILDTRCHRGRFDKRPRKKTKQKVFGFSH